MPITHQFVSAIPDRPEDAAAGKTLPSHWNAAHVGSVDLATEVTGKLPLTAVADIANNTILGNNDGSASEPEALTPAEVRTMLGLDATGTGAVNSVTAADTSLTISPTTGAVTAKINLGNTNVWTSPQTVLQNTSTPSWTAETSSTSSSPTDSGAYFQSKNTSGLVGAIGAHTTGYSNPGSIFLASQYTMESYGAGGTAIGAWGTGADIAFFTANGGITANRRVTIKSTGTTEFEAGSTAAGSAPIKLKSGSLMTSPEVGAVEFLTDKFYGTISTSTARKELTLNDAALTSGRVPFTTTNGRLTDNSTFLYDSSNNRLNIGGASTAGNDIFLSKSAAGQVAIVAANTSNGTGAYGGLYAINDGGANAAMLKLSSGFTTSGLLVAGQTYMVSSAGSVLFGTSGSADTIFVNGGTATTNEGLRIDSNRNVSIGNAALATNATNGFLYIPSCAGTPTGVPTAKTGRIAMIYDTSANKIWFYNGSWRGVVVS